MKKKEKTPVQKELNVFDCINNLNFEKADSPELKALFNPFIVNKAFSLYPDTILFANEMNINHHLTKRMQHDFYLHGIRKRKRWAKWPKKLNSNIITLVSEAYNVSYTKALVISKLLTDAQIEELERYLDKGGKQ